MASSVYMQLILSTELKRIQTGDDTYHKQHSLNVTYLEVTSPGSLARTAGQHSATPGRL